MKRLFSLSWMLLVLLPASYLQAQSMGTLRVLCVKARDGRVAELRQYLTDTTTKMGKMLVDDGRYSSFYLSESVAPAGQEARCDFQVIYGAPGAPKRTEPLTDADLKKAGVSMTIAERNAKRDALSSLVATEYWPVRDFVGSLVKGGYVRVNYFKVKRGATNEWVRLERSGWKQLAEAWAKETPGRGWGIYTLAMPSGTSQPHNAMTVDTFPTWESMFGGGSPRATWVKVHPERDYSAYMDQVGEMSERTMVTTMRMLEAIRK